MDVKRYLQGQNTQRVRVERMASCWQQEVTQQEGTRYTFQRHGRNRLVLLSVCMHMHIGDRTERGQIAVTQAGAH